MNYRLMKYLCFFPLILLMSLSSYAQTVLKGRVLDEKGSPLPGASIRIKSTGKGVVADAEGNFSLGHTGKNEIILFNFLGYEPKEIAINAKTANLNVSLQPNAQSLSEVVINVGYGTAKKSDITGAVSTVNAEAIAQSGVTSIDQVLQGRVAGVQLNNNTGLPGGSTSIQIRGLNSINSTNEPIFVIDGVIIASGGGAHSDNAFSFINPNDIESLEILKDASATAIYGAQAANGVILITTKKGKKGAPKIQFDAKRGWQEVYKFLNIANLREYAEHSNALNIARGNAISDSYVNPAMLGEGSDWQRSIFAPANMMNYNLSLYGGNDATTYKLTGSYLKQDGAAAGSGFDRFTFSTGLDSKIKRWVKLGGNVTISRTNQLSTIADWNLINSAVRQSPAVPVRNLDGTYGGPEDVNDQLVNPLALAELLDRGTKRLNLLGAVNAEVTPLQWLSLKTEFSTNLSNEMGRRFIPKYSLGSRVNSVIENQQTQRYTSNWTWRNLVTLKHVFEKIHSFNTVLGYEITDRQSNYISGLRYGGNNELRDLDAGDILNSLPSGNTSRSAFNSLFGRLNYSLLNRYVLTATIRYDGSSNFANGYRWGSFPSAAFAWRISEEKFIKNNVKSISNLKLRLGYGEVGNSNIRQFAFTSMLANVPTIWGTGQLAANVPNPLVTWETTKAFNLGLDVGLWKNRIEVIAELYDKKTDDLLLSLNLPAITGTAGQGAAQAPWGNVGAMQNRGFELTVNTVNVDKKNFKWRSNIIFSINRNKVIRLNEQNSIINKTYQLSGQDNIVTRTEVGRSIGDFFGYRVKGRINSASDIYDENGVIKIAIPENQIVDQNNGVGVGDLIWEDANGDGVINEKDRQYLGSPLPKFNYGFGSGFSYKDFELNFLVQGVYGNKIMNFLNVIIDDPNIQQGNLTRNSAINYAKVTRVDQSNTTSTNVNNFLVTGGDPNQPRISINNINANNRISSRFIEDGSYLRLQNVNFSYNLPGKFTAKLGLSSIKANVNIQNVFTISGYSGFDPEVGMTRDQYSNYGQSALLNGLDAGRYPTPRTFTFGIFVGL